MNFDTICEIVSELALLKFFPSDPAARLAIARMLGEMAANEDQVRWLVRRMTSGLYNEWPGPRELRACFCSRFRPRDGISISSEVYLDGIPSERPELPAPAMKALPAGHSVSASPSIEAAVHNLAETIDIAGALRKSLAIAKRRPPQVPVVNVPPERRITQADIDREVEKLRESRGKQQLEESA